MAEIISKPEPKTIRVTDIDIRFPGETAQFTLKPGDTETATEDGCRFDFANGEVVTIRERQVLWTSRRERDVILPPDPEDEPAHRQK